MCVFSDVIGVPSEASLHSGVQGVLGGEGKLHMVLKQASKHFLCVQFPLYNLSKGVYMGDPWVNEHSFCEIQDFAQYQ